MIHIENHSVQSIRVEPARTSREGRTRPLFLLCAGALIAAASLSGCGSSSGSSNSDAFHVHGTQWSVGGNTKVAIAGFNIAWLADEATTGAGGTDLNGDGDKIDASVVFVNATSKTQANVGVAATDLVWVGAELYMVVSEALDGRDWNADADMTDTVLVHWSFANQTPVFVDELSTASSPRFIASGTRLVYASAATVTGANVSSLRTIEAADPLTPVTVTTDDAVAALHPVILKADEGLVFLGLSEVTEARDLNGDGDSTDTLVLALLDLRTAAAPVRNVGLALPSASSPLRARSVGSADWQVGFLVHEADQGNTNLNDPTLFSPTWQATQCIGAGDVDTNDDIVFYLRFAAWVANPITDPPRNTGLVGVDRIAIANGFIATITPESSSNGTLGEGTCDLNGDGDKTDRVVRWTQMVTGTAPILPPNAVANIHALDDLPGGTHGIAELQDRFVIVVDEAADNLDINGDSLKTFDLAGWILPATTPTAWTFLHSGNYVGASWMTEMPNRANLGLALQESVGGMSLNPGSTGAPGDSDLLDSIPTFPTFSSGSTLRFPGVLIAVDPAQPGIVVTSGFGYYRVAESADNRDWSGDGQLNDHICFRSSFSQGTTNTNGISSALNRPVIEVDPQSSAPGCAAMITDETNQGVGGFDINGDGDKTDLVLQYFVFH